MHEAAHSATEHHDIPRVSSANLSTLFSIHGHRKGTDERLRNQREFVSAALEAVCPYSAPMAHSCSSLDLGSSSLVKNDFAAPSDELPAPPDRPFVASGPGGDGSISSKPEGFSAFKGVPASPTLIFEGGLGLPRRSATKWSLWERTPLEGPSDSQ